MEDGGDFGGDAKVVAQITTGTDPVANSVSKGYSSEEQGDSGAKDSTATLSW